MARVMKEEVDVVAYDPMWPGMFEEEKGHLLACLPPELVRRIEHFGSTAVPDLPAKPIVDMIHPMHYPEIYPPEGPEMHPLVVADSLFIDKVDRSEKFGA